MSTSVAALACGAALDAGQSGVVEVETIWSARLKILSGSSQEEVCVVFHCVTAGTFVYSLSSWRAAGEIPLWGCTV